MTNAYVRAADTGAGHAATRLLVYMAFRALDDAAPPVSFLGRDAAAEVLGYRGPESQRYGALKKVIAELKRLGLISLRNKPHEGRRAEYVLHLSKRVPESSPLYRSEGGNSLPSGGKSLPPEGGSHVPPKDKEKTKEERATSPNCSMHPNGTDEKCGPCARARRAFDARFPGNVFTVMPGSDCGPGNHRLVADGTCTRCEWRAA